MNIHINSPTAMEQLGSTIAGLSFPDLRIHLCGDLGTGKTTFVRGFLDGQGYHGKVKSPTYTLVEPYAFNNLSVFHFDLYRLKDPFELEAIGYRDYLEHDAILLIEWPERAATILGQPDLEIAIAISENGREITLESKSDQGGALLANYAKVHKK